MRASLSVLLLSFAACQDPELPATSYYDEQIAPIFEAGCVGTTTGCHVTDARGTAAGNLDLSSYDDLARRFDVLAAYGPYSRGLLFLKAGEPISVTVDTFDPPDPEQPDVRSVVVRTDIRHNAGVGLETGTAAFSRLSGWVNDGFQRSGAVRRANGGGNLGDCRPGAGADPGFSPDVAPADGPSYDRFVSEVMPVLRAQCAGAGCHGAPLADLYYACGDDEAERRWNYYISTRYLSLPLEGSELVRRPLAQSQGGGFHAGGAIFATRQDPGYVALRAWADDLAARRPDLLEREVPSEGLRFFANRVQPALVRKGCFFLACHSPISFHELKLRGGSGGSFARPTTELNYELARHFLALESPDPNASRLIGKNLFAPEHSPGSDGIVHRGGALFEDFGPGTRATPAACDGVDVHGADLNTVPAYCVLARWHQIERETAVAAGEILPTESPLRAVVWVARSLGSGDALDFDTYRPGADLRIADAQLGPDGGVVLGDSRSLLASCGLDPSVTDVRGTTASWNGELVAFGARSSAAEPLRLYEADADGSRCGPVPGVATAEREVDGIAIHDFDPAYAPDGRLVFASTRGNLDDSTTGYRGPTRTPSSLRPNANLYVWDALSSNLRQLTFLLNSELSPSFLANGRVVFTTEKREPGFRQLALRRQNLDGGDYHPLFGQRDSMGASATNEVVELLDHDLAFIAGAFGAPDGGGLLAIASRSIGPDQSDRDPQDRFYLHSLTYPGSEGVYRSPAVLPSRRILVSCDLAASLGDAGPFDFDLCEVDRATGATRVLTASRGVAELDAVALFARENRGVYVSRLHTGEANAAATVEPGELDARVYFTDFPMIATLLFSNTREGRPIDARIGGFDVWEALPPPAGTRSFADLGSFVVSDEHGSLFVDRRRLGHVPLLADGSVRVRLPGGVPILLHPTGAEGEALDFPSSSPMQGPMVQREEAQYYPGERITQSIPRRFFNGVCGGCHGSITGREVDVAPNLDVLTGASETMARGAAHVDIYRSPEDR